MFDIINHFLYEYGPYLLGLGFIAVMLFALYSERFGERIRNSITTYKKIINIGLILGIIATIVWFISENSNTAPNTIIISTILTRLILALVFIGAFLLTWRILERKDSKRMHPSSSPEHPHHHLPSMNASFHFHISKPSEPSRKIATATILSHEGQVNYRRHQTKQVSKHQELERTR